MHRPPASAFLGMVMCFTLWGVLPIYWKQISGVGSDVAVAHRILWTMVTVIPMLLWRGEWKAWCAAILNGPVLRAHAWSGLLLGINWSTFVWAAQHNHILDSSLGYFINPLLNVFIGWLFLGERLSRLQKVSVTLASIGTLTQVILVGRFPWVGIILALSMGFYGLARRRNTLGPVTGLAMETLVALPLALGYLIWSAASHQPVWGHGEGRDYALLMGLGIITAIPLLGFAHGARHLPFATLGLLQFLTPTGQFLVAVLLYGEPVSHGVLASFALIWTGVAIFITDLWRKSRLERSRST